MATVLSQSSTPQGVDTGNPGGFAHIPALDGIRGMAILLVLIDHLFWANGSTGSRIFDLASRIRASTYCGVNLFFALSGFLITGILIDTLNVPHYFRTFYARRTLRIFPLYYGSLLALLLLTWHFHFSWGGWQYYFLTYTSNLALWRSHIPLQLGVFNINHFWSLQVEEQFYLVWPLVVYRIRKPETLVRISLISCIVILGIRIFLVAMRSHPGFENIYLPYSPTFSCADNILFGCCLSALVRTRARETVLRLAPRIFAIAAAILLVAAILNGGLEWTTSIFIQTLGFSLIGITSTAVIAMTLKPGSNTQSLFQNRALRFLGTYSYGIYVFHYSLAGWLTEPMRLFFNQHLHSKALSVILEALAVGVLSILVALLSYRLYEVPFLRLKSYFSYNRSSSPTSA
ncbi:acyltransferase family protein [Granulicella arctica]|uniref:Peptidoglycan/LPS O-acetylase OafA/YrhL n=1 Tax=Granulicella arctica TaxID=940613 RepID=A0A7Y9PGW5_9BACT|nr:acyltransferase [Granulicella arctica]NYF79672.1 peptidoglycan/LPS O-acetylase OafA/YrhL [Granulicella arctica]